MYKIFWRPKWGFKRTGLGCGNSALEDYIESCDNSTPHKVMQSLARGLVMQDIYSPDSRPSAPNITMVNTQSSTSITLNWTQPEGQVADSYEVSFSYQGPCSGFNHTNTTTVNGTTRQYTLTELQEFSNYTVTVVAVNDTERSEESSESIITMADGTCISSMML